MNEKMIMLLKEYWSNQDVMKYFDLKESVAKRIKQSIVKDKGLKSVERKINKLWIFEALSVDYSEFVKLLEIERKISKKSKEVIYG